MARVQGAMASPIGALTLVASDEALVSIHFPPRAERAWDVAPEDAAVVEAARHPVLAQAARELREYFAGTRQRFDVALAPEGTAFQARVWLALREIPYAETTGYGVIARAIGQPTASRAVGAANGQNPIPIIVPCHRVIGANGSLVGFGGGLPAKQWLLAHEAAHGARQGRLFR